MPVEIGRTSSMLRELISLAAEASITTSENNFEKYKTSVASIVSLGPTIETATQQLFAALRTFDDQENIQQIVVELYPDTEKNGAYRNRLIKASSTVVE